MLSLVIGAVLSQYINPTTQPLRPPNGTYLYSMSDSTGAPIFKSTLVIQSRGSTFEISETTKLPNGQIATARTTWSTITLLPLRFEVHQGNEALGAQITRTTLKLIGMKGSFARIQGTSYIIPSVGLIANSMMLPYLVTAHPGESLTMAEIQNNQTVLIRPASAAPPSPGPAGDVAIAVLKAKKHGDSADQEQIIEWLNQKTGVVDGGRALPGNAKLTLMRFTPGRR